MATKKFLLTWTAPVGNIPITGYKVEYGLAANNNWTEYNETFTSTSGFVTGLNICTYYDFRVYAVNNLGYGQSSNTGRGIKGNIPFAPIGLSGSPTDTTIQLSWTMPNNGGCPITKSLIEFKESADVMGDYILKELNNSNSSYTVTGLIAETTYNLRLRSVNIVGTGSYSSGIFVTTTPQPSIPGQATNLQVQYIEVLDAPTGVFLSLNSTTGNLSWNNLDMTNKIPLSGYYIRYKASSTENWITSSLFSTNSGTITGLTGINCYSYDFGVAGLNISGTLGNYSVSITGNFGKPGAPTNITISPSMEGKYGINWAEPATATGYNFYATGIKLNTTPVPKNDFNSYNNGSVSYDNTFYYPWGFNPSITSGTLTISAVNQCGEGPQSTGVIVPAFTMEF